jgi:glutathione peroxidase
MQKLWAMAVSLIAMWTSAPSIAPSKPVAGSAYDFEFPSIDGQPLKLSTYRGKALLIVNTASFCGYKKQYAGLREPWTRYGASGLVVIGVPSNDFGEQEPKSEGEIKRFCHSAYGFPLTAKQVVVGPAAHPFHKWAAEAMGPEGVPNWNFQKYLIGRDGRFLRSLSTKVPPTSDEVESWISKALSEPTPAAASPQN